MMLQPDDPRRREGTVFLDEALAAGPAAHVLVIGVGDYKSAKLRPLTSTTVSARAVADWFLGTADEARFRNPDCPLGSVAVVLSEGAAGASAVYAGGEVPRASFVGTKAAVRAWVGRLNAHKDNMAVLYAASHGESRLGRTAFLLEDFGLDPFDATAGMSEIEQFVGSLENAAPVAQLLLFDCCRTPADMRLPWNTEFGTKLIALTRSENDHGEPRSQWVIAATSAGEAATGRTGKTTLFAEALLDALNGVASDTAQDGWPVRPGTLFDRVASLLALHRLPEERAQTPSGRMAGSFDITLPGERPDVPVYVSLNDPADWPDSFITVETAADKLTFEGEYDQPPFWKRSFSAQTEITVAVTRNGAEIGRTKKKAYAPALFLQIRKGERPAGTVVGRLEKGRSFGKRAEIVVAVASPVYVEAGAVADIVRRDEPGKNPKRLTVPLGGEARQELSPGDHSVTLATPDGRVQMREVTVSEGEIVKVEFAAQAPPPGYSTEDARPPAHQIEPASEEGLPEPPPAALGGTFGRFLARVAVKLVGLVVRTKDLGDIILKDGGLPPFSGPQSRNGPEPTDRPARVQAKASVAGFLDVGLRVRPPAGPALQTVVSEVDDRFLRIRFLDQAKRRFARADTGPAGRPLFAHVEAAGRSELVALPCLGSQRGGGWDPHVVVDRSAPADAAISTVVVDHGDWAGLLGFLASRDMAAAARILESGSLDVDVPSIALQAFAGKRRNPLAAVAGALVTVAAADPELERRWDPWVTNLADWFPGIPDGPIILGRRLLTRARNAEGIAAAKARFVEGFDRGAPLYSLCVDWLARGLESIADDDPAFVRRRRAARRLADRTDSTKTFTVIRDDD